MTAATDPTPTETSPPESKVDIDLSIPHTANKCQVCRKPIHTMCYKGTGVCGLICKKTRDGDI